MSLKKENMVVFIYEEDICVFRWSGGPIWVNLEGPCLLNGWSLWLIKPCFNTLSHRLTCRKKCVQVEGHEVRKISISDLISAKLTTISKLPLLLIGNYCVCYLHCSNANYKENSHL